MAHNRPTRMGRPNRNAFRPPPRPHRMSAIPSSWTGDTLIVAGTRIWLWELMRRRTARPSQERGGRSL